MCDETMTTYNWAINVLVCLISAWLTLRVKPWFAREMMKGRALYYHYHQKKLVTQQGPYR